MLHSHCRGLRICILVEGGGGSIVSPIDLLSTWWKEVEGLSLQCLALVEDDDGC
jgi:hypothetical protein